MLRRLHIPQLRGGAWHRQPGQHRQREGAQAQADGELRQPRAQGGYRGHQEEAQEN